MPSPACHFTTCSTDPCVGELSTKATCVPSKDNVTEVLVMPSLNLLTLYAHITVGALNGLPSASVQKPLGSPVLGSVPA